MVRVVLRVRAGLVRSFDIVVCTSRTLCAHHLGGSNVNAKMEHAKHNIRVGVIEMAFKHANSYIYNLVLAQCSMTYLYLLLDSLHLLQTLPYTVAFFTCFTQSEWGETGR